MKQRSVHTFTQFLRDFFARDQRQYAESVEARLPVTRSKPSMTMEKLA
jgi:hypothetical protein